MAALSRNILVHPWSERTHSEHTDRPKVSVSAYYYGRRGGGGGGGGVVGVA